MLSTEDISWQKYINTTPPVYDINATMYCLYNGHLSMN